VDLLLIGLLFLAARGSSTASSASTPPATTGAPPATSREAVGQHSADYSPSAAQIGAACSVGGVAGSIVPGVGNAIGCVAGVAALEISAHSDAIENYFEEGYDYLTEWWNS
jgi:hypothetical protein